MTLEQRQMFDKNKNGNKANILVAGIVVLMSLLALTKISRPDVIIRLLAGVADIIVNVVAYKKLKEKPTYRRICCISILLLLIVILATSKASYMYIYLFPIIIMVLIYSDRMLSRLAFIIGIVATCIYCIVAMAGGIMNSDEMVMSILISALSCYLVKSITELQIRHGEQNVEAVKAAADEQAKTADEIVTLAEALNQKFVQAKAVSENLNQTMDTSHNAVSEIAEGTHTNAEAIQRQTEQTADIQSSIQAVGEEARNMGEISERTNATVLDGVALIERLKKQATEVAKINTETRTTTQALNDSIKDVEEITATILGISSQTNLLALNASIEAARAGEAGKGFAVVADEIRTLSEDTRKATEQISAIIEKLTKDAEEAAASMTTSAEYAEKQNELIEETGIKLSDIKADTDALSQGVGEVNRSVDNIISASTEIMDSISSLSATGEEVAASTDEALNLSESTMDALQGMNGLLQEINDISVNMEQVANK